MGMGYDGQKLVFFQVPGQQKHFFELIVDEDLINFIAPTDEAMEGDTPMDTNIEGGGGLLHVELRFHFLNHDGLRGFKGNGNLVHFDDVGQEVPQLLDLDEFVMNLFVPEDEVLSVFDVELEGNVVVMPFDVRDDFFHGLIELFHCHDHDVLGHFRQRIHHRQKLIHPIHLDFAIMHFQQTLQVMASFFATGDYLNKGLDCRDVVLIYFLIGPIQGVDEGFGFLELALEQMAWLGIQHNGKCIWVVLDEFEVSVLENSHDYHNLMTLIQLFKTVDFLHLHPILRNQMIQHVLMILPIIGLHDGLLHHPLMLVESPADLLPQAHLLNHLVDWALLHVQLVVASGGIVDELELVHA